MACATWWEQTIHPDIATLAGYLNGLLSCPAEQAVKAHLAGCETCRSHLQLLRSAWPQANEREISGEMAAIWDGIQSKIRQWRDDEPRCLSAEVVRGRVAHQVGRFLGGQAAHRVLELVSPNNHNLYAVLEPLLGEFLGRSATASLIDRCVDATITDL